MFTGIIEEIGTIQSLVNTRAGKKVTVAASQILEDTAVGDSIAVEGVCVTVTDMENGTFSADLLGETFKKTTFKKAAAGKRVNLERAAKLGSRLGGHMVTGHIDETGTIVRIVKKKNDLQLDVSIPSQLLPFIISKGSIALDGISLTVVRINKQDISVCIIPHTVHNTTMQFKSAGDLINVEVDFFAKYIYNYLSVLRKQSQKTGITKDVLRRAGFM